MNNPEKKDFLIPNINVDNLKSLDFYLSIKPTYYDIIKYYWIALIYNQHHKMNYIHLKSRIHRTEMFIDYYTKKGFEIDDEGINEEDIDIEIAYKIIHRIEWILTEYGYMLWTTRAPYEEFLHKYIYYRDDILNIKNNNENEEIEKIEKIEEYNKKSNNNPPLNWNIECYEEIIPRTNSRLIKHSVYLALDVFTMLEFMKNDIDRNDDLLFKLIILTINGLIFLGQFLWERYI